MSKITLAHGAGGRLSNELIKKLFVKNFTPDMKVLNDAALLKAGKCRLAVSTDSFVISPIFFPGGDIGKLAVCGSINDIAMMGGVPLALTAACIIEEGFSIKDLQKIVASMTAECKKAGIKIIAGDTKVVEKGKADGIFINTTAIGMVPEGINLSAGNAKAGDSIIVSGNLGDHASAILIARNKLPFKTKIISDCAALDKVTQAVLKKCSKVALMRDVTRGGLAAVLNEISESSNCGISINDNVPVSKAVRALSNVLGLDPLHMANEGKFVSVQPEKYTKTVLNIIKKYDKNARVIGTVINKPKGVWVKTPNGSLRKLVPNDTEQLPRIC
jgi:hydrogenase expression/formation protein HypE